MNNHLNIDDAAEAVDTNRSASKVDWQQILRDSAFSKEEIRAIAPERLLARFNPLPSPRV
jgi:uncharacterized protein YfkK (UPF0435 family)